MGPVRTVRAPQRDKRIRYNAESLPRIDSTREYAASDVVTGAMKEFARDPRIVSIDSDLATTSGERLEAIESPTGWLSEGHGLDLTMLATGANFETRSNGATHMGNDDSTIFDGLAHLKIIDVSCPQQMLAVMRWIMDGNRGLLYVRVMRTPSPVLYGADYSFEFGKGHVVRQNQGDVAVIVSSGRGVHEALSTAARCAKEGLGVGVIDMPSIDEDLLVELCESGKLVWVAEQNNGYILQNLLKIQFRHFGGWS